MQASTDVGPRKRNKEHVLSRVKVLVHLGNSHLARLGNIGRRAGRQVLLHKVVRGDTAPL